MIFSPAQVIVARRDFKAVGLLEIEMFWMFCDMILERFGDGAGPPDVYTPDTFQKWCEHYKRMEILNHRTEFKKVKLPL